MRYRCPEIQHQSEAALAPGLGTPAHPWRIQAVRAGPRSCFQVILIEGVELRMHGRRQRFRPRRAYDQVNEPVDQQATTLGWKPSRKIEPNPGERERPMERWLFASDRARCPGRRLACSGEDPRKWSSLEKR